MMYRHGKKPKRDITATQTMVERPPREELETHCATLNAKQIGEIYGVRPARVRNWCRLLGLRPQEEKRPYCKIEADMGRDAAIEWIATHTIDDAKERWPHTEQVYWRWERHLEVKFLRVCKDCGGRKNFADMAMKHNNQIFHICKVCYSAADRPKMWSKSQRTSHQDRIDDEYASVPDLVRIAWSAAQGINGYMRGMSLGGHRGE